MLLPFVAGVVLSAGVAVFARQVGLDRDRAFYPTVMIVIASYYVLFGAMSGSVRTVVIESLVMALFAAAAVAGFKSSTWIVVAALAGHGAFDAVHGHIIENAGTPAWWPAWCLAYDVGAAAGLGWLLRRGLVPSGASSDSMRPDGLHGPTNVGPWVSYDLAAESGGPDYRRRDLHQPYFSTSVTATPATTARER